MLQSRPVRIISSSARLLSGHDLYALPGENGKFNATIQDLSSYPQSYFSSAALNHGILFNLNNLFQLK